MQPPCSPLVETIDAPVVRQVMTHYRPIVPIQSTLIDLVDSLSFQTSRWLFVTDDDTIVGAVKTATLTDITQRRYPLETLQLSTFQHFPVLFTTPDTPLSVLSKQLTPNTPVAIVQNTMGEAIGYVDLDNQYHLQTRHQLKFRDVEKLLQYPWLKEVSGIAAELDTPIYLIGGFVRDWFLNRPNDDIDFAVEGEVHNVADTLAQTYGGTVHHFHDFGGAHWITEDGMTIDLTVCRAEIYPSLSELPQVSSAHIDKDLERRDFNINAMAISLHPKTLGMLFDPFDGLKSLYSQSFTTLHALSFFQDPTRIFRASRYAARFDFTPTALSIQQLHGALNVIQPG